MIDFRPGGEGKPGINTHNKPEAALGDPIAKSPDVFVSLGGNGSLIVGIKGLAITKQDGDDVTVFVSPDSDLRSYRVEALPAADGKADWVYSARRRALPNPLAWENCRQRALFELPIKAGEFAIRTATRGPRQVSASVQWV